MNQLENLEIKTINHLGIIAGIIDEIGIVEIINEQLGGEYKELLPYLKQSSPEARKKTDVLQEIPIRITHGYSRDHRPDLKQFMLNMIVSGDGDVPIFISTGSGNQSDKKVFGEIARKYKKQLEFETTIVSDSALYSENNLRLMKEISWVTRVPFSLKKAKEIVSSLSLSEFTKSEIEGYAHQEVESNYAGIKQRWLVVESQARKVSDLEKLEQKITRESQLASRKLASLSKKDFESEIEANLGLKQISSKLKYHLLSQIKVAEKAVKNKQTKYQITAELNSNNLEIISLKRKAGRFIIATNKLDNDSFTSDDILKKYKEQQAPERGFRFLKDPLFFADSVFLKKPQRVETMAMLMGLCLMVYSLGQRQIRVCLKTEKTGIKNQLGKLTEKPTLRWIFQCFQGIHLVCYQGIKQLANLTIEHQFTLNFFPESCRKYYILSG
jgi:transposase